MARFPGEDIDPIETTSAATRLPGGMANPAGKGTEEKPVPPAQSGSTAAGVRADIKPIGTNESRPGPHILLCTREGDGMATKKAFRRAPPLRITLPDGSSVVGSHASLAKILELTLFRSAPARTAVPVATRSAPARVRRAA